MTTSRTGSAIYQIVADEKARHGRKRCGNVCDSPCLTLFLLILLVAGIIYFIFGLMTNKKAPGTDVNFNILAFDNNSTTALALQPLNDSPSSNVDDNIPSKADCYYDKNHFKNISSSFHWSHAFETPTCTYRQSNINALKLFVFEKGSLRLNKQLFCSECNGSSEFLHLDNQKIRKIDQEKGVLVRECSFEGISLKEGKLNYEVIRLNVSFNRDSVNNFALKVPHDFVKVSCRMQEAPKEHLVGLGSVSEQFTYERSIFQVLRKDKPSKPSSVQTFFTNFLARSPPKPSTNYTNVIILVLSSLSKGSFHANLKESSSFLAKNNAYVLHGFNSLGSTLEDNLMPLLTGKLPGNLSRSQGLHGNKSLLDPSIFLWKKASQNYVTLLAEDQTEKSVLSFKKTPADHYMKPFWLAEDEREITNKDLLSDTMSAEVCSNITQRYKGVLEYILEFYKQYKDVPKFAVAVLSHYERSQQLDTSLHTFLKSLENTEDFSKTVIILTGGGGETLEQKGTEDQMGVLENSPFAVFLPSQSFQKNQKEMMSTLQKNSQTVTTSLHLHYSILSLLAPNNKKTAGQSLFEEGESDRSCQTSGVPLTHCTCKTS